MSTQIKGLGEIPLTLTVSTVGTAGEGKPDYEAKPASADKVDDEKSASSDSGMGVGGIVGIVAGVLALLALIWAFLRRRGTAG